MNENDNKYLSLKTAAGLYGYTRDHLGLMIRQGKLKGIKLGSYYVTTKEWVADYLKNYADPFRSAASGKFSNKFLLQAIVSRPYKRTLPDRQNPVITEASKECAIAKESQEKFLKKSENNFFSEIQKELLPSLRELSEAREEADSSRVLPNRHYTAGSNPYVILPIRKMDESERKNILTKISNYDS